MNIVPLINYLNSILPLSTKIGQAIESYSETLVFKKGEQIENDSSTQLLYITSGLLMGYMTIFDEKICCWISRENELTFPSQVSKPKGYEIEYIEALEHTEAISLPLRVFNVNNEEAFDAKVLERCIYGSFLKSSREMGMILGLSDIGCRLSQFIINRPGLAERIPSQHLASHLGSSEAELLAIGFSTKRDISDSDS